MTYFSDQEDGERPRDIEKIDDKAWGTSERTLTLAQHYAHLTEEPFYGDIVDFMKQTPVPAMCLSGDDAVPSVLMTEVGPLFETGWRLG